MSALTKVFIVLLVILSVLMTAATVVFVSRVEEHSKIADAAKLAMQRETMRADAAEQAAAAAKASADSVRQTLNTQMQQLQTQLTASNHEASQKDVLIAEQASKASMASADVNRLAEALKSSEDTKSKQNEMIADLRKSNDELGKQSGDLNLRVSDLTNKLDVTERERRNLAEQLTESKSQGEKLSAALKDHGISVDTAVANAGKGLGAVSINGVIREVRPIAGIPYATISVGSADSVSKGMEFKIYDRANGEYLGDLTVDTVEPNEAVGRLTGKRVAEVRPGNEVRTQM